MENLSAIDVQSIQNLDAQLPSSCFWILRGLIGFSSNLLLLVSIARKKHLRTNFYISMLQLSLSEACYSFASAIVGGERLVLALLQRPQTTTPAACLPTNFAQYIFANTSPALVLAIALERILSVAMPVRYLKWNFWPQQLVNAACWVVPIAILVPAYYAFLSDAEWIPNCTIGLIWLPAFNHIEAATGISLSCITILLYIALVVLLRRKAHRVIELVRSC